LIGHRYIFVASGPAKSAASDVRRHATSSNAGPLTWEEVYAPQPSDYRVEIRVEVVDVATEADRSVRQPISTDETDPASQVTVSKVDRTLRFVGLITA
jgi:hypothetical protein